MKTVTIIGMGLIGGSLGMAIKNKDLAEKVIGVARSKEHLEEAKKKGALDEYTIDAVEASKDADLIFVTTPMNIIASTVKTIAGVTKKGCIITDAGSSKASIVEEIERSISSDVHFIGGHPMAGTEHQGIRAATKFLLEGANYVLTPTGKTNPEALEKLKVFLSALDVNIVVMEPKMHDLAVAGISHMPLAVAVALVNTINDLETGKEEMLKVAASGFRDTTRIAAGNIDMGKDMFTTNKAAVLEMIEKFKSSLNKLEHLIKEGNTEKITKELERAKDLRIKMYAANS